MNANLKPAQPGYDLYDHEITWLPFAGIENLELTIFDVDEERKVVDLMVRFAPSVKIAMHNHLAQTNMLIIQGELRIYETDGSVREARTAGRYYRGRTDDVHVEGGGPEGAVVFYSMRCDSGPNVLEVMDDEAKVLATLTMDDVRAAWEAQKAAETA